MATVTTRHPRGRQKRPAAAATGETVAPHAPSCTAGGSYIEPARRDAMIAEAAYFLAERRGFYPGGELEDWLAAEREIDRALSSGQTESPYIG